MVLTKAELIGCLQNEVRILLHLAGKVGPNQLDYRPSAKQRSTLELLQYLTIMGPQLIKAAKSGTFDRDGWGAADAAAKARNFDQTVAAIQQQSEEYAALLGDVPDADFQGIINIFGYDTPRGVFIVNMVLGGCAAYRTQLFLYLKASGRDELNTMNLWAGMDGSM
ncbi:MAG: hypothetical protein AB7I50_19190 [Vicinamibacterales bacterium]